MSKKSSISKLYCRSDPDQSHKKELFSQKIGIIKTFVSLFLKTNIYEFYEAARERLMVKHHLLFLVQSCKILPYNFSETIVL